MAEAPAAQALDIQDPLPESNWVPRRVYAFLVTAILLGLRAYAMHIKAPTLGVDLLITLIIACYMMGASGEQLLRGLTVLSALRSGVQFRKEKTVTQDTPEATTEATASTAAIPTPAPEPAP
jgi:hypothetical protein